jgi:hypothetical protein
VGQPHRERNGVAQENAAALKTHNTSNNCHSILIIVVGSKHECPSSIAIVAFVLMRRG